jgi:hypothetical protein
MVHEQLNMPDKWRQWIWLGPLTLILAVVYWRTILPSMGTWGDSAKYQFLGKVLGTPHPSGNPLYIVLNHLFVTLIPKGGLALKANLLSACFTIVALCFFYAILILLKVKPLVAFISALTFGFTYTLWYWSLIAEVYTLNLLFMASVIYFLLKWNLTLKNSYFLIACALYAISFGNHLLTVLLLPAFVYITLATDKRVLLDPKNIIFVGFFILLGISQYGYIVWRTNDPNTKFLETNTLTLIHTVAQLTSKASARMRWSEVFEIRIPEFIRYIWRDFYILIGIGIWGAFQIEDRTTTRFFFICLLISLAVPLLIYAREYDAYFLSAYLVLFIFIGVGLDHIAHKIFKNWQTAFVLVLIPGFFLWMNYGKVDQSEKTLHARITERILREVGSDAVIITHEYDYTTFFWYYLLGEGYDSRNLYAFQLTPDRLEEVQLYLEGNETIYLPVQRMFLPEDLRVYVMEENARRLAELGLAINETTTKYIFEVTLPEIVE